MPAATLDHLPAAREAGPLPLFTGESACPAPPSEPSSTTPVQPRPASRLRVWAREHRTSLLLVAALLVVVGTVLGTGVGRFPAFADDEGTYVAQAWSVSHEGRLAHYTYWYDHPPLGWLQLSAVSWILAPVLPDDAVVAGRVVMLIPALVSAALVFLLGRRLGLRRPAVAAAVLLFACTPLAVGGLRQVYLDNLATPWLLGAFVLALSPRKLLWSHAAAGACCAVAVLTKETSLVFVPAVALAVAQSSAPKLRSFSVAAFTTPLVLLLLGYPLFALLKGELLPGADHVSLFDALRFQLWGRDSTGSALDGGSGSGGLVAGWLRSDPWLLGLGVLAAPTALTVPRLRPVAAAVVLGVLGALRPGYLPEPYVLTALPFCALVVAGMADTAFHAVRGAAWRLGVAGALACLLVAAGPGWASAVERATSEDATAEVLTARRFVLDEVDPDARVLVDDTFYVDLVEAGFEPRLGVVWFYKLGGEDLDPSVGRALPGGATEFDFVVSTPAMRSALERNPGELAEVRRALVASDVVETFGEASSRVELRRLRPPAGSGRLEPADA